MYSGDSFNISYCTDCSYYFVNYPHDTDQMCTEMCNSHLYEAADDIKYCVQTCSSGDSKILDKKFNSASNNLCVALASVQKVSVAVKDGSNPHYRLTCILYPDDPSGTTYANSWKEVDSDYVCFENCYSHG